MATAFADEDDVPPLEDLSELIGQVNTLHCTKESKGNEVLEKSLSMEKTTRKNTSTSEKQSTKTSVQTFGGFQKGFLNKQTTDNSVNKKRSKSASAKDEKIPTICPKQEETNSLRFPEVQKAMECSSFLQNRVSDWVTDDLLKKLEGRPDLLKKLADPRYSQALNLIRTNPEEGLKLVQGNQELLSFIEDFCGILGEHFTSMAENTNSSEVDGKNSAPQTASNADEEKMSEILSDPATLEVLKDPWISKLIKNLKENPTEARRMLATSRPEVLPKIKKLIDAGILSYDK